MTELVVRSQAEAGEIRGSSLWRRVRRNTNGFQMGVLVCLALILLAGILAPILPIPSFASTAFVDQAYAFPSWAHPFGVDAVGHDFLSENIYAIRTSLSIGGLTAVIGALIGIPLGLAAGYRGGRIDWMILRLIEITSVIPPLLLAILLANLIVANVLTISLIIGMVSWVGVARLVRAKVLSVREMPFVDAARAIGAGSGRIAWRHLLPNSFSTLIVALVLTVPGAIGTEAGLSFLGMGISPPTPDWGQMIATSVQYINYYWFLGLFPALMLSLTVVCLSLAGDWLRDLIDPESRTR